MQQEKYSIGWNTFQTHLQETQRELYHEKHFADVTLVSDDMVQVKAHRTILYSASSVFKQLLMMNENNMNQILYLKGIKYEELKSLLQFIYLGEAQIHESRIDLFVSASYDLDIKELNKKEEEKSNENEDEKKEVESDLDAVEESGTELRNIQVPQVKERDYSIIQSITSNQCPDCNANFSTVRNLKRHYKNVHAEEKFACNQCDKVFSRKDNLDTHIKNVHMGLKFPCDICDRKFTQRSNLITHTKNCR